MTPRAIRTAVAMLLQLGAVVLLALVVLGRPWPADRGDAFVYLLADRSASVATEQTRRAVQRVESGITGAGGAVVRRIDFAGRPEASGGSDAQSTNIEAAIELALNRRSTASRAAIVVVSDGNATEGDTRRALQSAADAGVQTKILSRLAVRDRLVVPNGPSTPMLPMTRGTRILPV